MYPPPPQKKHNLRNFPVSSAEGLATSPLRADCRASATGLCRSAAACRPPSGDSVSRDEMFSNIYKIRELEGGILLEVEGKRITRTEAIDDSAFGANPSAEELSEANEAAVSSGVDIILNHKLISTLYNKKQYSAYIKKYMKDLKTKLEETNPERVDAFVAGAVGAVKMILGKFKDFEFYTGESMNHDAMVGLLDYREDGITPIMLFFKDGLEIEKCWTAYIPFAFDACHQSATLSHRDSVRCSLVLTKRLYDRHTVFHVRQQMSVPTLPEIKHSIEPLVRLVFLCTHIPCASFMHLVFESVLKECGLVLVKEIVETWVGTNAAGNHQSEIAASTALKPVDICQRHAHISQRAVDQCRGVSVRGTSGVTRVQHGTDNNMRVLETKSSPLCLINTASRLFKKHFLLLSIGGASVPLPGHTPLMQSLGNPCSVSAPPPQLVLSESE
ncbi:hypothetical protein F2P81_021051 [Scophthalmus maximus]|uniref:Translationally-controlled tumor protein homolog n=1 Tax=Scophthalmus maximus TaxID=52904 RepID=A0A6A4S6W3_SCOMX|nr:hypothetical protein F2P81_021051 [Scophthalmus maximus]